MKPNFLYQALFSKATMISCALGLSLALTACGGGSSGGSGEPANPNANSSGGNSNGGNSNGGNSNGGNSNGGNSNGGNSGGGSTAPVRLFSANGGVNTGIELWKTDGTEAGTVMVKDINTSGDSNPVSITKVGTNKWFFLADDGTHGKELWITDGTEAGTNMVKDIRSGATDSNAAFLTAFGDKVLFSLHTTDFPYAGTKMWISDGTEAGTHAVTNISPNAVSDSPVDFAVVGNQAYFKASGPQGRELYVTDGTDAGTRLVRDISPGTIPGTTAQIDSFIENITAFNDRIFFTGSTTIATQSGPIMNIEPWYSNGSHTGVLKSINPGNNHSMPSEFTASGDRLYFIANDGTNGVALWATDGGPAGTALVVDTNDASTTLTHAFNPRTLVPMGDRKLFFISGTTAAGQELFYTDGTAAGTLAVETNPGADGGYVKHVTRIGDKVVFTALDDANTTETQLWVSDGTVAGTEKIKVLNSSAIDAVSQMVSSDLGDNKALISVDDGVKGHEIWITDGTAAGTTLLKDINPDALNSAPSFVDYDTSH